MAVVKRRVRFEVIGFPAPSMQRVGVALLADAILPRIRSGLDVADAPAPALKPHRVNPSSGYAAIKVKKFGGRPLRDWWRTGHTLTHMAVIATGHNQARLGFTTPAANLRAAVNNRRHKQFGISPRDRALLALAFSRVDSPVRIINA